MIEYLQKFMLGSLMLYSVYYLFLRNEKTLRFNRFYLLALIPISLAIPLITVQTSYIEIPNSIPIVWEMPVEQSSFTITEQLPEIGTEAIQTTTDWGQVIFYVYVSICLVLFIRFTLNLYKIRQFKRRGELIQLEGYQVCLKDDLRSSFTFLNTVYTNKDKYLAELLPSSILEHERAHVRQKHSYDIIFIEFMNVILWFNPLIYLIKRSIKLNHEFLADEAVCTEASILPDYQRTLINYSKLNSYNEPIMASRLTFGETKKRLNMMVKNTHKPTALVKQSIGMIAIAIAVFALGNQKVIARETAENPNLSQTPVHTDSIMLGQKVLPLVQISPATKIRYINTNGNRIEQEFGQMTKDEKTRFASPESQGEVWAQSFFDSNFKWRSYQKMLTDARKLKNNELPNFFSRDISLKSPSDTLPKKVTFFSPGLNRTVRFVTAEGDTIQKLFKDLNSLELERFRQNEASPAYYAPRPAKMDIPENFAEVFSNEKEYGIWLDGNRIPNSKLKNYEAKEIYHYFKSELMRNAKNYGAHTFQLNIYTNEYYQGKPEGTWINILNINKKEEEPQDDPSQNKGIADKVWNEAKNGNRHLIWIDGKGPFPNLLNFRQTDFADYFRAGIYEKSEYAKDFDYELILTSSNAQTSYNQNLKKNELTFSKNLLEILQISNLGEPYLLLSQHNNDHKLRLLDFDGRIIHGEMDNWFRTMKQRVYSSEALTQLKVESEDIDVNHARKFIENLGDSISVTLDGQLISTSRLKVLNLSKFKHILIIQGKNPDGKKSYALITDEAIDLSNIKKQGLWVDYSRAMEMVAGYL